jgi:hypothetical protein
MSPDRLRRLVWLRRVQELERAGKAAELDRAVDRAAAEHAAAQERARRLLAGYAPAATGAVTAGELADRHQEAAEGLSMAAGAARRVVEARRLSELGWRRVQEAAQERRKMATLRDREVAARRLEESRRQGREEDERAAQGVGEAWPGGDAT